uniref:Uncharacterized protein n=1 Tax=Zea mays TaxID=4577 RepID=A0A804RFS8_MAIZE
MSLPADVVSGADVPVFQCSLPPPPALAPQVLTLTMDRLAHSCISQMMVNPPHSYLLPVGLSIGNEPLQSNAELLYRIEIQAALDILAILDRIIKDLEGS